MWSVLVLCDSLMHDKTQMLLRLFIHFNQATTRFDRPMSNGMAALSREDTKPQSFDDAHCSSAVQ